MDKCTQRKIETGSCLEEADKIINKLVTIKANIKKKLAVEFILKICKNKKNVHSVY